MARTGPLYCRFKWPQFCPVFENTPKMPFLPWAWTSFPVELENGIAGLPIRGRIGLIWDAVCRSLPKEAFTKELYKGRSRLGGVAMGFVKFRNYKEEFRSKSRMIAEIFGSRTGSSMVIRSHTICQLISKYRWIIRSRVWDILFHSMAGYCSRNAGEIFFDASPITSIALLTA